MLSLFSPADILQGANAFFYGQSRAGPSGDTPSIVYVVASIVVTVAASGVLVWRYRRLEP